MLTFPAHYYNAFLKLKLCTSIGLEAYQTLVRMPQVHRIGRTGRAGRKGISHTYANVTVPVDDDMDKYADSVAHLN